MGGHWADTVNSPKATIEDPDLCQTEGQRRASHEPAPQPRQTCCQRLRSTPEHGTRSSEAVRASRLMPTAVETSGLRRRCTWSSLGCPIPNSNAAALRVETCIGWCPRWVGTDNLASEGTDDAGRHHVGALCHLQQHPRLRVCPADPVGSDRSQRASAISYTTWALLFITHVSTVAYALVNRQDFWLAACFAGNALCCLCILAVAFWKRCNYVRSQLVNGPFGPALNVRLGSCVTSIDGPNGAAQLYWR